MMHASCCGQPECIDPCPGGSHPLVGESLGNLKLEAIRFAQKYGAPTPGYPYRAAAQ